MKFPVELVFFLGFLLNSVLSLKFPASCTCPSGNTLPFVLQLWRVSYRMVMLGDCSFHMGSNSSVAIKGDREEPVRLVRIGNPFWIDITEVTRDDFSSFVHQSKFLTMAEQFGTSFVFSPKPVPEPGSQLTGRPGWWIEKKSVTWKTDLTETTKYHPVVHVSWTDAMQYCKWKGASLPTEKQWEYACRGGLENNLFPWGNKLRPDGVHMANIWQGRFPLFNSLEDGFETTAPVSSYPSNGYGIYDMAGNVWEWVFDSWSNRRSDVKIQKGGSFMCHRMHCYRYRCGARTKGSFDSTSSNLGFRCSERVKM